MAIPKSVQEQVDAAEKLHQQVYGSPDASVPGEVKKEVVAEQPPQPNEQPAQPEQPAPQVEHDAKYWESRFSVLEGKYRAEVPRYAEELRQQRQRVQQLEQQLSSAPAATMPDGVVVPEEFAAKYGEEFANDLRRMMPAVPSDILEKVERIERVTHDVSRNNYFAALSDSAPSWRSLNTDTGFLTWLAGMDDFSGRPRQELFDAANESMDVGRVAAFFNSYGGANQSLGSVQPNLLASQVTPDSGRSVVPPPSKKSWTQAEIAQFYQDSRRGKVTAEQAERIEQDIFAAQREGRIR